MIKRLIPKLEYPVLEKCDNRLRNKDNEEWVYFGINTQVLKLNDLNAENKFVERLSDFVEQINLDTHYVMLPKGLGISEKNELFRGSETVRALVSQIIDSSFSVRNDSFF